MNIRKIIREEISRIFKEDDMEENPLDGTIANIETQLQNDLGNISTIINTQNTDIKNKENEIKTDLQLKSKLDAKNPHKKGLEREIPEKQKDFEIRKKQLKDLENAQKGLVAAQKEIEKQKVDMANQAKQSTSSNQTTPSVLPSLESPI